MIYDYITDVLHDAQPVMDEWRAAIIAADRARQVRDQSEQQHQEQKAGSLGQKLLHAHAAATHYLVAVTDGESERKDMPALRTEWQRQNRRIDCLHKDMRAFYDNFYESPDIAVGILPLYSFVMQFKFRLTQPYLSRDEQAFYSIDNPVRKDRVFDLPYVAPSTWKGSLRAAIRDLDDDMSVVYRLCGNEKGVDDQAQLRTGRLRFFPTFFTQKSLEVINPHDREAGVGQQPILLESVPSGAIGAFALLYIPFDRIGCNDEETRIQVAADLRLIGAGLRVMFRDTGFGAKTSNGFGIVHDSLTDGLINMLLPNAAIPQASMVVAEQPATPPLPRYLTDPGRLKPEYLLSDGMFRYRQQNEFEVAAGKKRRFDKEAWQEYEKARKWWERVGRQLAETAAGAAPLTPPDQPTIPTDDQSTPALSVFVRPLPFSSFQELTEHIVDELAQALTLIGGSA